MKIDRLASFAATALVLFALSGSSFAFNESLSFRLSPTGTIQAVVSGMSDGPACQTEFVPPESIVVQGDVIAITSEYVQYFCPLPSPPQPYSVSADLGNLTGQTYQVTWTEGPLNVSATLVPGALTPSAPNSIPALSWPSLVILAIGVALAAFWKWHFSERPR